ncbi:MAG TPA: hypothetical protein VHE55_10445 [Fimbriimonadaceae bacterium]|nr:hypothetical protein [Fimbriimonadaceae bacterium]
MRKTFRVSAIFVLLVAVCFTLESCSSGYMDTSNPAKSSGSKRTKGGGHPTSASQTSI